MLQLFGEFPDPSLDPGDFRERHRRKTRQRSQFFPQFLEAARLLRFFTHGGEAEMRRYQRTGVRQGQPAEASRGFRFVVMVPWALDGALWRRRYPRQPLADAPNSVLHAVHIGKLDQ